MSEQNMNTDEEQITVTLTMEDDEEIDCAVLTTYSANGREYIALLPLNEEGESDDGDVYLYRYEEVDRHLAISKTMTNTTSLPMHLTSGWMSRNLKNYKKSSFTKREGLQSFPFFSFT